VLLYSFQVTGLLKPVNKEVRDKIMELVTHGVTSVSEMRRHLNMFVHQLFPVNCPPLTDMGYFPADDTIINSITLVKFIGKD